MWEQHHRALLLRASHDWSSSNETRRSQAMGQQRNLLAAVQSTCPARPPGRSQGGAARGHQPDD
jgi:hypothetical protein